MTAMAIPAQHPQIIAAPAPDLTDRHPVPASQQALQPHDTDPMPAQPGIDKIQFPHIRFYIPERDTLPVE
jgi:hypothetical protein